MRSCDCSRCCLVHYVMHAETSCASQGMLHTDIAAANMCFKEEYKNAPFLGVPKACAWTMMMLMLCRPSM